MGESVNSVFVLSRREVRELDRRAIERVAIPSIVLMENAARNATDVAVEMLEGSGGCRVLVVCGRGNNGGDGLAMARHLHNAGADVRVALVGAATGLSPDAKVHWTIVGRMGLRRGVLGRGRIARGLERLADGVPDLLVDALLGTGLERPVEGAALEAIGAMNGLRARGCAVLGVDLPSGMDCDLGVALGAAVRVDVTVTFAGLKPGFLTPAGRALAGRVVVADIGAPAELAESLGRRLDVRRAGTARRRGRNG